MPEPQPVMRMVSGEVNTGGLSHQVRASYIIGADGANSLVRRLLGQEFKGKAFAEDWLVVNAKQLLTPIDHFEFICDPRRPTPTWWHRVGVNAGSSN